MIWEKEKERCSQRLIICFPRREGKRKKRGDSSETWTKKKRKEKKDCASLFGLIHPLRTGKGEKKRGKEGGGRGGGRSKNRKKKGGNITSAKTRFFPRRRRGGKEVRKEKNGSACKSLCKGKRKKGLQKRRRLSFLIFRPGGIGEGKKKKEDAPAPDLENL